jgi:uncharacterized membrane protein YbhN (UPF0104 family)
MTALTLPTTAPRALKVAVRLLVGGTILGAVVWHLGTTPFLAALHDVDATSMAAAAAIAVLTTICCAWRWTLVARGLGVEVPWRGAVAAYYRSQFLNTTLPGGILGDVHRGLRHGRDVGDVSRALRAVVIERSVGQVVQLAMTVVVLVALPSPVRPALPVIAVTALLALLVVLSAVGVVALGRARVPTGQSWWARTTRGVAADLHGALLDRSTGPRLVGASLVVVAGHAATFLIAARLAGSMASPSRLLPLALLALLAMGVPANIAGWGPREGMAAWTFAAAGLGAAQGLTTAVVYGVLVLVASLPGAAVVLVSWRRDWHG